jgi:hypothetical protein
VALLWWRESRRRGTLKGSCEADDTRGPYAVAVSLGRNYWSALRRRYEPVWCSDDDGHDNLRCGKLFREASKQC